MCSEPDNRLTPRLLEPAARIARGASSHDKWLSYHINVKVLEEALAGLPAVAVSKETASRMMTLALKTYDTIC